MEILIIILILISLFLGLIDLGKAIKRAEHKEDITRAVVRLLLAVILFILALIVFFFS